MTRLHASDGFSLVEVMVATTLFGTLAGGLAVATIGSMRANSASRNIAAATALVYDQFDQLRALDLTANPADLKTGAHSDASNPVTETGGAGGIFTRTWNVTAATPRVGLAEVVVQVSWEERGQRVVQGVAFVCVSTSCS